LNEGCYWSGTITKLLDEDRVEVRIWATIWLEVTCYAH
jgi:hypothetical protein